MTYCCPKGVESYGPLTAPAWIIGIQPGRDELKDGRPFTGPNGKLLSAILTACDLSIDDFYLDNVMCGPNCTLDKGFHRFTRDVKALKPKLIITLGAPACEAIVGQKLGKVRGQMVPWTQLGIDYATAGYYLPCVQPIAALQGGGPAVGSDLVRDFKKINYILEYNPFFHDNKTYEIITSPSAAQEILANLPKDSPTFIDIETTESDPEQENAWDHQLICVGLGNEDHADVFTLEALQGLDWSVTEGVIWGGHNAWSFDRAGLARYLGIDIEIRHDTLLQSYALDERRISSINTPLHKLKPLCREYIGADFWESGKAEDVYKYNALDVMNDARLHNRLVPLMQEDDVYGFYTDILLPASHVLSDAQIYGCRINVREMARLLIEWMPRLDTNLKALQGDAYDLGYPSTLPPINPNSPKQLSQFLFEVLGLPGGPSTAKAVLDELDHPFVKELQSYRQLDKMLSTYIFGIKDDIKYDQRIHPKPLLHGTVTGRPAYTDPPVQTIPQEHTVGSLAELRRMFIPTNDDYVIMEADYAQLDIWMGMCLSEDQNMLTDLTQPYWEDGTPDFHSRVTQYVLNTPREYARKPYGSLERAFWENRRFAAKKVTFGPMFMEGAQGLANKNTGIGCTLLEAQTHLQKWYSRYKDFRRWQLETVKKAHTEGELTGIFGQKRRFPLIVDKRSDRQAGNFPIQHAESGCTLTSAIELHPQLLKLDSHILWLVHDSIVMEVPRKYLDEVALLVKFVMTKPRAPGLLGVPVEIKAGSNWYDTSTVKVV